MEIESKGYIHLMRKVRDGNLWTKGRLSRFEAWIDLILSANGLDKKWQGILIKRGSFITSQLELSKKWHFSLGNVNKFLRWLESENRIEIKTTNQYTHITILKYEEFNPLNERKNENKVKTKRKRSENEVKLRKKGKKGKKGNRERYTHQWFFNLKDFSAFNYKKLDIEKEWLKACDWIEMHGKRYKNYKAFFNNWLRKGNEFKKEKTNQNLDNIEIPSYAREWEREDNAKRNMAQKKGIKSRI